MANFLKSIIKWINRSKYPYMYNKDNKINDPFWLVHPEGFLYKNPIYTDDNIQLNEKGIKLKDTLY